MDRIITAKEPLASGPKLLAKNIPVITLKRIIIALPESIIAELNKINFFEFGIKVYLI